MDDKEMNGVLVAIPTMDLKKLPNSELKELGDSLVAMNEAIKNEILRLIDEQDKVAAAWDKIRLTLSERIM